MAKLITITFEVEDTEELFGDAETVELSIHEAFCQLFLEGNPDAQEYLNNVITDVKTDDAE